MEHISIREFSRRMGVSDTAIRKAIKSKRIISGVSYDKKNIPFIIFEVAKNELLKTVEVSTVRSPSLINLTDSFSEFDFNTFGNNNAPKNEINNESFSRINDEIAFYKKQILKQQYEENEKILVKKTDISKALYEMGVEIRTSILSIPEKTIDNILASVDRTEAVNILKDELVKSLIGLATIHKRELQKK